jgi:hypothetical protein
MEDGALMRSSSALFDRLIPRPIGNRAMSAIFNIDPISNFVDRKKSWSLPRASRTNNQHSTYIYMKQYLIL